MFILLSAPLLQAPLIRMDPYGFFTFEGLVNTPIPYLLALVTNLVIALVSCLIFDSIRRWKYYVHRRSDESAYVRALWTSIPPVLLVFAFSLTFISFELLLYLSTMLPLLAGVSTALGIFHDKGPTLTEQDRKSFLWAAAALFVALAAGSQRSSSCCRSLAAGLDSSTGRESLQFLGKSITALGVIPQANWENDYVLVHCGSYWPPSVTRLS